MVIHGRIFGGDDLTEFLKMMPHSASATMKDWSSVSSVLYFVNSSEEYVKVAFGDCSLRLYFAPRLTALPRLVLYGGRLVLPDKTYFINAAKASAIFERIVEMCFS